MIYKNVQTTGTWVPVPTYMYPTRCEIITKIMKIFLLYSHLGPTRRVPKRYSTHRRYTFQGTNCSLTHRQPFCQTTCSTH